MDGPQKGRFLYNAEEYMPSNKALYQAKLATGLKVRAAANAAASQQTPPLSTTQLPKTAYICLYLI